MKWCSKGTANSGLWVASSTGKSGQTSKGVEGSGGDSWCSPGWTHGWGVVNETAASSKFIKTGETRELGANAG